MLTNLNNKYSYVVSIMITDHFCYPNIPYFETLGFFSTLEDVADYIGRSSSFVSSHFGHVNIFEYNGYFYHRVLNKEVEFWDDNSPINFSPEIVLETLINRHVYH